MKWLLCLLWALFGRPSGDMAFSAFMTTREAEMKENKKD